jgi:hypothetical protein
MQLASPRGPRWRGRWAGLPRSVGGLRGSSESATCTSPRLLMQLASPRRSPDGAVDGQGFLVALAGFVEFRERHMHVAQAAYAVGFAQEVPDGAVDGQGFLVALAGLRGVPRSAICTSPRLLMQLASPRGPRWCGRWAGLPRSVGVSVGIHPGNNNAVPAVVVLRSL